MSLPPPLGGGASGGGQVDSLGSTLSTAAPLGPLLAPEPMRDTAAASFFPVERVCPAGTLFFLIKFWTSGESGGATFRKRQKTCFLFCSARTRPNTPPFEDAPLPQHPQTPLPQQPKCTLPQHPNPTLPQHPCRPSDPKLPNPPRPQPPLPASTNPLNRTDLNRHPPPNPHPSPHSSRWQSRYSSLSPSL